MPLQAKLKDADQKMLWVEAVHMCECVSNIMATTGSTTSRLEILFGKNIKIIGLFLQFKRIVYDIKRDKFRNQMADKTFKAIMVGYDKNHTRYMYKLYNT